jgi:2-oxoglutarate dehydrogenase E1 component
LNHLRAGQHQISIYDSLLSEYAVLGFDYGYAVADPKALVIWEAQFGDFGNGAQIMFDQFLVAAEAKWQQTCSLVCLLPHGYEGQGPEHSSARLERYLQLCAEDNIQVCNFSTPANLFHALRRQLKLDVPKPLIIMSPKSLLRHKLVVSHVEDFTKGAYQPVIPAVADPATAKRLVFCSGKMSCDIREAIEAKGGEVGNQVAMARLEQFYPFPMDEVIAELKRYPNVTDICWVQEEPENMGAGRFVKPYFDAAIAKVVKKGKPIRYIGRKASASTATGNSKVHAAEQAAIIDETLSV